MTEEEDLSYTSGNVMQVNGTSVRALETVLYQDTNYKNKVVGTWGFFRLRRVRVTYVPRHRYPPSAGNDGAIIVISPSVGKDYSTTSSLGINAPINDTIELPSAKIFHSFDYQSFSIPVADQKWYPVQDDETTYLNRKQYDLWLLFNYIRGSLSTGVIGSIIFHFDLEVKTLLI